MTILLLASSVSDLRSYRIPNYFIVSGWLTGLAFRLYRMGVSGLGSGMICIVTGIVLLLPLYLLKAAGAGDVKLLSVICGMYGVEFWLKTVAVFGVLAAVVSMVHMIRKKSLHYRFTYLFHYIFAGSREVYYDPVRDGREMTIPLAPVLTMAYYIVYLCR
jgi:prepilin peptidase CpaA